MGLPHNGAMQRRLAVLVLGAALASSSPALADNTEAGKAFDEGRKLRDQRDFEKAAAAFERSVAAEPSIGAYYNLAFSYEQLGRTRDALDAYRKSQKLAKDKGDPREKEASEAVSKLLDTHNYVTLVVSDDVERMAGVRVAVDGEAVPPRQLRGEVFRSGTQHEVVVTAPGRRERRTTGANKQPITVSVGEVEPTAPPSPPPAPPPAETSSGGWGWQKWTGAGMIGAGAGGVAFSLIRIFSYLSDESSLDSARRDAIKNCVEGGGRISKCDGDANSPRVQVANDALTAWNANEQSAKDGAPLTIGVGVVGALLIGGGIYLFATAPSAAEQGPPPPNTLRMHVVPQVGGRDTGLSVVGTF